MRTFGRLVLALPLLLILPLLIAIPLLAFALTDLLFRLFGKQSSAHNQHKQQSRNVSVVIPNWNGRDLLAKYLPSVIAAGPDEIVVVDNGSTDGSADFIRANYPHITL